MSITKEQQQALDDALVPREQRLTIGSCNYRLSTTFKPKEPTFQVALDVLSLTPFYQAFLITASVPAIYMQEFWNTASYHKHTIRFKMNKKSYSFDLDTFRNILQICPKLPGQHFVDTPFEEDILAFMRELGYSGTIKLLSDVKVDLLPQPWRTFATIINKCLSGKVTGIDTLRLSRAQILWGLYHQENVDFVYLLWEDLVYQIKNKESRKNKYLYYPRFTMIIINHFMSQDQSILRRNKVDWHMANDDPILTIMRFIPQHKVVQKYGAILPDYLTNPAMKALEAYKTYHDLTTGKVQPKPKYVRRSSRSKTDDAPNFLGKRVKANCKMMRKEIPWMSSDETIMMILKIDDDCFQERHDKEDKDEESFDPRVQTPSHYEPSDDEANDDLAQSGYTEEEDVNVEQTFEANINLEGRDAEMIDAPKTTQVIKDTHVTLTLVIIESKKDSYVIIYVPVTSQATTTLPQPSNPLIPYVQQTPTPTLATTPSSSLLNLPNFGSLFGFDDRLKRLEADFSEFKQTNQYATALSSIPNIVDNYLGSKLKESVDVAVQLKSDRLREEAQTENESFLNKHDATMQTIIKEQVNARVKKEVSKILPRIEKLVNEQLESEVLIRSSHEAKSTHAVAANLSELELKKILIDKMESNKSIDRSDEQKNLYKALVDAYAADKDLLDAYGDTVTIKRRQDKADDDQEPSAGIDRGSKRRRVGKEPESSSASKETTSKSTGKSTEGSKCHHQSAGQSAPAEEPIHTEDDFKEPTHQEFKSGVNDDQPEDEIHPHPNCDEDKGVDYRNIKWIKALVPNSIWSEVPVSYDKYALWGISHGGRKRQQFYGYAANRESAKDFYSRQRIIAYESDSEDEQVSLLTEEQKTPSFANQQVKSHRETVKNQFTHSKNPKVDKKRVELNKKKGKENVQRENKPVWNNVQRVNHKNQFVPRGVLTRSGKIPVSTASAS
ncbi:hypothetical protein Tco_1571069, partial [Tanacetum coccineum]